MPNRAAIALGSNLPSSSGSPEATVVEAIRRLGELGQVIAASSLRETAPVGLIDQPRFINAAVLLDTALDPLALLRALLALERSMGRERTHDTPPKGPRVIDLDLLLFEDASGHSLELDDPELILPHPEMHRRGFVLDPLAEIAPSMRHPILQKDVASLQRVSRRNRYAVQ